MEKFMNLKWVLALFLLLTASRAVKGAETPHDSLLVLSKGDLTLSIVDPATLTIVATVPSGLDPHEVIASDDGATAYISNYGGGTFNTITVVDLAAQKTLPVIDLGALRGPHGLTFVAGKLWFTVEGSKAIGSYDPAAHKVDWILGTGQDRTHMIYVTPGLSPIFTTNVNSATVSVIEKSDTAERGPGGSHPNWTEVAVPVGKGSEGFDVSPDGKEIWVANAKDGTISVIDVSSKEVVQTIDANARGANRLKFTLDGKLALVSSLGGKDAVVFDRPTRKEVKRITVGSGAAGILMQPDGTRAFVACTPDSYVAVIDLKTLQMTGKISAGKNPDGLAWAARK
jgi:YVTN family beta-propeller protein